MAILPPYFEGLTPLSFDWFPTKAQCFIYRNWDMVTPVRMARILDCDEATVCSMASEMGLRESTANEALWRTRGYVTLIRANWHLLTYPQLCLLLDWDEDYLAFILHEDDFLDVKLGKRKPPVEPLRITPLDGEGVRRTAAIRRVTEELQAKIPAPSVSPFDFSAIYPKGASPVLGESRLASYLCPYETLYGDIFYDHTLIEAAFPDDMLAAYQALGVGGLLCQAVLYALVPCKYDPSLSQGWERRIEGLRLVIARLQKYGLKLYLYINEPREMTDKVFEKHPHLKGDVQNAGYASLCLSVPEAQDFLRESIRQLTAAAPGLGGYFCITASENHTNCYSHKFPGTSTCPRCGQKAPSDIYALAMRLIYEGATAADPDITVIAGNWAWDSHEPPDGDIRTVKKLPREVAAWAVSERGVLKRFEDTEVKVADYSISIPGPSEKTMRYWSTARERGGRIAAKLQLGNSWELSSVPYIPAFGHFYTAIKNLMEKADPDIVQMTWTMGGFPSPAFRMFAEMTRKDAPIPDFEEMMARYFPTPDRQALLAALKAFDDAFEEFPFSVISMYNGPQHMGPALPLWEKRTGWKSCMVGLIYDDMQACTSGYPSELYLRQFDRLTEGWARGFALLRAAFEAKTPTKDEELLLDCAEVSLLHFASARNHIRYVNARPTDPTALIREEEAMAIREAEIMAKNPAIGFEATNHYFYTRADLFEKVLNCRALLGEL